MNHCIFKGRICQINLTDLSPFKGAQKLLRQICGILVYQDAADLTKELLGAFERGEVSEIYLAYTSFKNTVVHIPRLVKLLPFDRDSAVNETGDEPKARALMNYEPSAETVLDMIIPKYMSSLIYGALLEAVASENGARMNAMDSATNNAEELSLIHISEPTRPY